MRFLVVELLSDQITVLYGYFKRKGIVMNAEKTKPVYTLSLIPIGIALNLIVGTIAYTLKTPIYLDAIGTIIVTLLIGFRAGATVGVCSFLLGGLFVNPVLPWFSGTQLAISAYVYMLSNYGMFKNYFKTIISGVGLGITAGIVSAPIITILFSGITGSGRSLLTAFVIKSGQNILNSVLLSGLASEPLDKVIQCILAVWLIKSLPLSSLSVFYNERMIKNNFITLKEGQ